MIQYEAWDRADLQTFNDYQLSLCSPIDSYLEDHILGSTFYRIFEANAEIGCFAIHEGGLLTLFHVRRDQQRRGQALLADIRRKHGVASALVPTSDEFLLSHVLDEYRELAMQAYFFADSGTDPAIAPGAAEVQYRLARPDDVPAIRAACGDFVDDAANRINRHEVTVGLLGGQIVAIGLIIGSQLWRRQASIGMFTAESHRRKGIGMRTIIHLKGLCREQGIAPLSGCHYKNLASKATLEAAGMVTRTRLLRVGF